MLKLKQIIIMIFIIVITNHAQIQTTGFPKEGFDKRIEDYVNDLWIIDTHEHLTQEEERLEKADRIDFTYLFNNYYFMGDIISAGFSPSLLNGLFSYTFPIKERWESFKPILEATRNTAYQRASLFAARDIYGIDDLNDSTYLLLSQKIREANKPGLYRKILKEKGKIDLSILDVGHQHFDRDFYRHIERFDYFIYVLSMDKIKSLGEKYKVKVQSLDDYVMVLRKAFKEGLDYKMIGIKSALAYDRIIKYNNTPKKKAEVVFKKLADGQQTTEEELKALQDYMMHRVLSLANEFQMPVQFHTGLVGDYITNSKPTLLINLFMKYPKVNFIIFHSSYPYGGELSVLAKMYSNVFIDMCWTPVISPAYSIRYLDEFLETVPANKIMAFGGDYSEVELAYAHSVFARRIVSKVLIEKVRSGYMSENEAINIAKKILRENALEIFKLKGHSRGMENIEALNNPGGLHDWWMAHNMKKGLVRKWKIIGPFPFGKGLDEIYPPEKKIEFNASYKGLNGKVQWKNVQTREDGYLDFLEQFPDKGSDYVAMTYAYTEIVSPDERDITLTLGSNDGAKVWLNRKEIYNLHTARGAISDQEFISVHLKKGVNKVLAKVENLGASWGLFMRVVDPNEELKINEFE